MRNLAKSRGRDYHKVFLPKLCPPLNGPKRKRKTSKARRKRPATDVAPAPAHAASKSSTTPVVPVGTTPAEDRFASSQDPFGQLLFEEYSAVDEGALLEHLSYVDPEGTSSAAATPPVTPAPCSPSTGPVTTPAPAPASVTQPDAIPAQSFHDSFPTSPAPSLAGTPSLSPIPDSYPDTFTPLKRDYAGDYEACMTAVQDLNRFSRVLFPGGEGITGSDGLVYTYDDVLPVLEELHEMLDRMFARIQHA